MAYVTQYTANFTNEVEQDVVCLIQKKDGASNPIVNLPVASMRITDSSDDQSPYACIISKELTLSVWADLNTTISWETFIDGSHDDWKVTVTVDNETFFIGFITPEEGSGPFQDKPYEINIKATDGLGLLKGIELVTVTGDVFIGRSTISYYIASALKKTGLDLPIRAYCTYLNKQTQNKYDSMLNDLFNTAWLNYRTFVKSGKEYLSCYDALKLILDGWCHLQQYQGRWQIMCLSDRQITPNTLYYVDYDIYGNKLTGAFDVEGPARVGKYELIYPSIYPINENQKISARYANKETRYIFNYSIPDNLIDNLNQTYFTDGEWSYSDIAYDRPTSTSAVGTRYGYGIQFWSLFTGNFLTTSQTALNSYTPLLIVEKDYFNNEIQRYFQIEVANAGLNTTLGTFIKNDANDFKVSKGDFVSFSVTFRILNTTVSNNNSLTYNDIGSQSLNKKIYTSFFTLLKNGATGSSLSDWMIMNKEGTWYNADLYAANLSLIDATSSFTVDGSSLNENTNEWKTVSIDKSVIPENGIIYLHLSSGFTPYGYNVQFKDLKITYEPFVNGSKFNIKGDYHIIKQSTYFPDKYEKEIGISDVSKSVIKGALLYLGGDPMTSDFYRFPQTSESRTFKQLVNLGYFNQTYRRMYKIEGEFTSLMYNDFNNQEIRKPIGFHKLFRFADMNPQRDFVLIPSLEMDILSGNIKATFVEVKGKVADGNFLGDVLNKIDYIFK